MTENSDVGRRDQVWDAVLRTLAESPASIKYGDVETFLDAEVSERTIHRVMAAMHELGWLQKDRPRGHYWYPGPKARQYLNLYEPGGGRPDVDFEPTAPSDDDPDDVEPEPAPDPAPVDDRDELQGEGDDELPEHELDADVEARIEKAIEQLDPPGSGPIEDERRDVARRVLRHIVAEGEARPSTLQETYFEAFPVGYGSARSWWKNFVYKALRDVDFVSTGGEGSPTWFYEPDE